MAAAAGLMLLLSHATSTKQNRRDIAPAYSLEQSESWGLRSIESCLNTRGCCCDMRADYRRNADSAMNGIVILTLYNTPVTWSLNRHW